MKIGPYILDELFLALAAHLEESKLSINIVVVGGASLAFGQYIERTTRDVDVIAKAERKDGQLILSRATPFPAEFESAVRRVARDFGLQKDWLNAVVDKQWIFGLPPELDDDITWRDYGVLVVGFVGRCGLIPLKFFAAVDQGPLSKHWQDLVALNPSVAEVDKAAKWVKTQDIGEEFKQFVEQAREQLLRELGIRRG